MRIKARKENLVTQDMENELFIYDSLTDKVYSLNETTAFVWNHLDGQTSAAELSLKLSEHFKQPADESFIWLAIDNLQQVDLLMTDDLPKPMSKLKRREAIKRIGLASMIALPVISSLVAPDGNERRERRKRRSLSALHRNSRNARQLRSGIAL